MHFSDRPRLPVEVDLLVGAARYAVAPSPAPLLVDEDNTVFVPFVHRPGGARGDTGWVEAMFTQAGQVEHEDLLEGKIDGVIKTAEVDIPGPGLADAGQVVVPVGPPFDLHGFSGQLGFRTD